MPVIKVLIALCPLDGAAWDRGRHGAGVRYPGHYRRLAPRAMASGISKATVPTMAGMIARPFRPVLSAGSITGPLAVQKLEDNLRHG